MIVLAFTGRRKSGKTTLIERLVKILSSEGKVAVVKHVHHTDVEFDVEGTDTWRIKHAGATAVVGLAPNKFFLNADIETDLDSAINLIKLVVPNIRMVLLEGFYDQIKMRKDVYRIIVVKTMEEAEELLADSHTKPLGIYCEDCDEIEVGGIPVFKSPREVAEKIGDLLRGET